MGRFSPSNSLLWSYNLQTAIQEANTAEESGNLLLINSFANIFCRWEESIQVKSSLLNTQGKAGCDRIGKAWRSVTSRTAMHTVTCRVLA